MSEAINMFSIQVDIDVLAAARVVTLPHTAKHDIDLLIKTVLTEAFGGAIVRPWSLHRQAGPVATVLGYSAVPVADIEMRQGMALPAIRSAIKAVYGHALPVLTAGQKFRFSVRLCPTIRVTPAKDKSHAHGEIDAFLVAVQRGETNINREEVYTRYLIERLKGASVDSAKLTKFRLEQMSRPHRGASAPSSGTAQRVVPDCVLEGTLAVLDPALLSQTLKSGVGRQRAFGRGYVRLEPPRVNVAA
jgi:CRISPR-associated protein Cse3 family